MKRLFVMLLTLLLVLPCVGCSKSELSKNSNPANSNREDVDNSLNDKTDTVETFVEKQYDENAILFVCQDRADNDDDRYKMYYYNYYGEMIKTEDTINIGFYAKNGLAPAYDPASGLTGFVDLSGVFVIEPKWEEAAAFSDDGIALVCVEEEESYRDKYGFINEKGEEIIPCIYDVASSFYPNGFAIVSVDEETIDTLEYDGEVVYTYPRYTHKYGVIDKKGNTIIEPQYTMIEHIAGDYIICRGETAVDIYNLKGNKLYSETIADNVSYRYQDESTLLRITYDTQSYIPFPIGWEVFDGNKFVEWHDPSGVIIESKHVATTSTGIGFGATQNGVTVIPYEYDLIAEVDSFYIAIKYMYKNGAVDDMVFDIYNMDFEKTAEGLEYFLYPNLNELTGEYTKLPSGYFEVWVYDERTQNVSRGIIDYTGKEIISPVYNSQIRPYTYDGFGGLFYSYICY